jgi:hypothetical protein
MAMNIGQVISRTFGVIKERFGLLLGVYGVFFAVQLGLFAVLGIGVGASVMGGLAQGSASALGGRDDRRDRVGLSGLLPGLFCAVRSDERGGIAASAHRFR